ncbi:MAG: zinc-ribbon domain-containing protein [Desulfobacter sp.]|nr:MAG: zinc-ribbon domain-containing protein [Desulfobacter sp.]
MNVTCPHCSTKLNLPDDKVPKDRDTSFKCPKCKGAIQVKASRPEDPPQKPAASPRQAMPAAGEQGMFRRSSRARALVCMAPSGTRDLLSASIQRLDFSIDFPKTPENALDNLEYQIYPLVVLDDAFDLGQRMISHMNDMDMSLRRRICLVRVEQGVETGNAMAALHGSVNFVFRLRDIDEEDDLYIEDMLNDALENHKRLYAVYNESMKVAGKA